MKQGSQLVPSAQAAPFSAISPVGETAARCVLARAFAKQDGKAAGGTEFKASAADCAVRPGKKVGFHAVDRNRRQPAVSAGSTLYHPRRSAIRVPATAMASSAPTARASPPSCASSPASWSLPPAEVAIGRKTPDVGAGAGPFQLRRVQTVMDTVIMGNPPPVSRS